jgi:hypothetical protein
MSTGKKRDRGKERFWRTRVRQWRRSGLAVRAYCEEHELSEQSFYAWRRTLAGRDAEPVRFVPVRVTPESGPPSTAGGSTGGLELVVGSGRLLRIGADFDAGTLQRLLAVLEEGRP